MLHLVYESEFASNLLRQLQHGVRVGRPPADSIVNSPNWPSASFYSEKVSEVIEKDLSCGRLAGPFSVSPFENFIVSPLGAFPKKNSTKIRVIHDLSYPVRGSVNSQISKADFSLTYTGVDEAVDILRGMGPGPVYMSKVDLEDAFKFIYVNPQDWHLLGFAWPNRVTGLSEYYFSKVLNFGLRSSPALFDRFASCIVDFVKFYDSSTRILRYCDDFIVFARSRDECQKKLDLVLGVCRSAGFSVQPAKVTAPSIVCEYLGIVLDSGRGEIRISEERLHEVQDLLHQFISCKSASKRKLLSLLGKLSFVSKVIRYGKPMLGRIIRAAARVPYLHYRVRLDREIRKDLDWWINCIAPHNGVFIYNNIWTEETTTHVYTDASDWGFGALCRTEWFSCSFSGGWQHLLSDSINYRELFTAVKALATWAKDLHHSNVIFHVDNLSACYILNKLYSPVPALLALVRTWCAILERFAINITVVYISTEDNKDADNLSRGALRQFRVDNPLVSPTMTWPAKVDIDGVCL